ncbi:putative hemin transport protein [Methylopila capsulata]|nr:putative hemin transport protein [Methylopila capsulata]
MRIALTRLAAPLPQIAADLAGVDGVVALTTNATTVMTEIGRYTGPCFATEPLALKAGEAALRVHLPSISATLAVERQALSRSPCSVQFFSPEGAALHKTILTSITDDYAFAELTQGWSIPAGEASGATPARTEVRVLDKPADPRCWRGRDLAFHLDSLFLDGGIGRRATLPDWGDDHAWSVEPELAVHLLRLLTEIRAPVATMVSNAAFAQIHQGAFDDIRQIGPVIRLCSEGCTISIDFNEIDEVWVTRFDAGGRAGHLIELYDWRFHCVAQFTEFGANGHLSRFWGQTVRDMPRRGRNAAS